jgi:TonB family protein
LASLRLTLAALLLIVACGPAQRSGAARELEPREPYYEFQVDVPARVLHAAPLRYPDALRGTGISGEALIQFVVDTLGLPEPDSPREASPSQRPADHPAFVQAARDQILASRFTPAERRGHKVRQIVQMPFKFRAPR